MLNFPFQFSFATDTDFPYESLEGTAQRMLIITPKRPSIPEKSFRSTFPAEHVSMDHPVPIRLSEYLRAAETNP